jgi:hypothetical protein
MKVISLTSIPPRFPYLEATLSSLLQQGADEVRLYIPEAYRRFPEWDGALPMVPNGVRISRCDEDYGPATKILPACRDLAGQDAQILFCDDDGVFASKWASRLYKLQSLRPHEAVASYVRPVQGYLKHHVTSRNQPQAWQLPIAWDLPYRFGRLMFKFLRTPAPWHRPFARAGYGDIFFGVGGVVVRPSFFDDVSFDVPTQAWAVDDIWLSAQLARRDIPVYCPFRHPMPRALAHAHASSLFDMTVDGQGRQMLNRSAAEYCRDRFQIWMN